jgi:N-sulfoglucosamine sulfohydrolase
MISPPAGSKICAIDYSANFDAFLDERPEGKPFYFWYGAREPHRPYGDGEAIAHGKTLDDLSEIPPYWPQEETIKSDMLDYAFEVEWFDQQLGKILQKLEETGKLSNTLVVVTSDNGAPFPRLKGQTYDEDFRLSFALMLPDSLSTVYVSLSWYVPE